MYCLLVPGMQILEKICMPFCIWLCAYREMSLQRPWEGAGIIVSKSVWRNDHLGYRKTRLTLSWTMLCLHVVLRNLLANPFNCNCHLAWLGEWLRRKRIVTGNPRCQKPYFLKEIPIQDVAIQDFTCDDGKKCMTNHGS